MNKEMIIMPELTDLNLLKTKRFRSQTMKIQLSTPVSSSTFDTNDDKYDLNISTEGSNNLKEIKTGNSDTYDKAWSSKTKNVIFFIIS
jgi:hypothetical protein